MSASNHPWPVSIYGTPQRDDERSKPFLSLPRFCLSFCLHFSPPYFTITLHTIRGIIIRCSAHARFLLRNKISIFFFIFLFLFFFSFQRKSQFSCICPTLFSSYRIYFHAVLCIMNVVFVRCRSHAACACNYPVLILIDEPSATVLDSDADRVWVSRPGCVVC